MTIYGLINMISTSQNLWNTKMPKLQKIPNLFLFVKCRDDQLVYFIMLLLVSFLLLINVSILGSLELFSISLIHIFALKIN